MCKALQVKGAKGLMFPKLMIMKLHVSEGSLLVNF